MKIDGLSLYHYEGCPFCVRVRRAMADLDIEIELRDVSRDPELGRELERATGYRTVPVLRIDDGSRTRWMPESLDIIEYLEERFGD